MNNLYAWNDGVDPDGSDMVSDLASKYGPGSVVEWKFTYTIKVGDHIIERREYSSHFDNPRGQAWTRWHNEIKPETGGQLLRIEAWAGDTEVIYEK